MFGLCGGFCSMKQDQNQIIFQTIVPKGAYQTPERKVFEKLDDIDDDIKVQKIVKSHYEQCVQNCKKSNQKYTDKSFPPNNKSLGNFIPIKGRKIQWMRITEIVQNPKLLQHLNPNQIVQVNQGDRYFLSSIASLAQNQTRIRFLFGDNQISPYGIYMVRVNIKGILKQIVVDDFFPVYSHNKGLVFSKPISEEDIWVMILEKVWAKINGSYSQTIFGYPHQVLTTFSNAPCFYLRLQNIKNKNQIWESLKEARRQNYPICCSSKPGISASSGVVQSATYSLANCFELNVQGRLHQVLALRNPWEQNSFTGPYSQKDFQFWDRLKQNKVNNINFVDKEGLFLIGFSDFLNYFQSIDISHIHSYYNYNFEQVLTTPKHGTYFKVEVKQATQCYFVVQQERRPTNRSNNQQMQFSRATVVIGKWEQDHYQYVESKLENSFPTLPIQCLLINPGIYLVYAKCEWTNGIANSLTFATYSSKKINITKVPKDKRLIRDIIIDYAYKKGPRTYLDEKTWISSSLLYNQGGFAYIFAYVQNGSNKKILLQASRESFLSCGFKIKQPASKDIKIMASANHPQLILLRVLANAKQIVFPPPIKISHSL